MLQNRIQNIRLSLTNFLDQLEILITINDNRNRSMFEKYNRLISLKKEYLF